LRGAMCARQSPKSARMQRNSITKSSRLAIFYD
jgi:hypothetical protein